MSCDRAEERAVSESATQKQRGKVCRCAVDISSSSDTLCTFILSGFLFVFPVVQWLYVLLIDGFSSLLV